jgi:hypothetical protein
LHGEVSGLLHRFDREIAGRVDDHRSLATDPGDDSGPVFVVMPSTGLALLATSTGAASQRLLATTWRLPFVTGGMVEVIRFHRAFELAVHLIGQGGIAQPPAPAVAGPAMDAQLAGNPPRRTRETEQKRLTGCKFYKSS